MTIDTKQPAIVIITTYIIDNVVLIDIRKTNYYFYFWFILVMISSLALVQMWQKAHVDAHHGQAGGIVVWGEPLVGIFPY